MWLNDGVKYTVNQSLIQHEGLNNIEPLDDDLSYLKASTVIISNAFQSTHSVNADLIGITLG